MRRRCYSLNLSDGQLVDLSLQGMLPAIREKFSGQEFESLAQLVQKVSAHESRFQGMHRDRYQNGVAHVDSYDSCTDDDEAEIGLAEWTKKKMLISCPWLK